MADIASHVHEGVGCGSSETADVACAVAWGVQKMEAPVAKEIMGWDGPYVGFKGVDIVDHTIFKIR